MGRNDVDEIADLPRSIQEAVRRVTPYERIKREILSGAFTPGAPLVEASLAEWCEVSRTPIREALLRLEQDRLIEKVNRGFVVRVSSREEILDLYDTKIVLESTAARIASDRRTNQDIRLLRASHEHMSHFLDDSTALAEKNREFHATVWRASHNEPLTDLLERLNLNLGRYPATTLAFPGRPEVAHLQHGDLIDAIESRNAEAAAQIASEHFAAARDIRLHLWTIKE